MPRKEKKYHFIYKTTCVKTNRFYVGMHSTDDLEDGYFGSGRRIHYSVKKHGLENHKIEILKYCDNREDLKIKEAEIITERFMKNPLCMNMKLGGEGGWDHINRTPKERSIIAGKAGKAHGEKLKNDYEYAINYSNSEKWRTAGTKKVKELYPEGVFKGRVHSKETKKKMSESSKGMGRGKENSQFGKTWMYSLIEKKSKLVIKVDIPTHLKDGWNIGRKMKF